jgi:hypothetical protein
MGPDDAMDVLAGAGTVFAGLIIVLGVGVVALIHLSSSPRPVMLRVVLALVCIVLLLGFGYLYVDTLFLPTMERLLTGLWG